MSHSPPPDPDTTWPGRSASVRWLRACPTRHPVLFWLALWVSFATLAGVILALKGLDGFQQPREKGLLLVAGLGWVYPFHLWIKHRRSDIE